MVMNPRKAGCGLFTLFVGLVLPIFCACRATANRANSGALTNNNSSPGVFTYHNDNARTGANLNETVLTPANVNTTHFGKLYSYALDGVVYAQPLCVKNVDVPGQGSHNLVFVATEHDSIYAFDADGKAPSPVWKASFADPAEGVTPVSLPFGIASEMGITGTPVIDPRTGTLYAVTFTSENGEPVYRLHSMDIARGTEQVKGGTIIQASAPGTGDNTDGNGNVVFNSWQQLQRPGLLLSNGVVYIAFGSFLDIEPYHGWLLGYDAKTLQQVSVFNTTPNASGGSIWMAGAAPAADDTGTIYLAVANGTFDANTSGTDFGESVLKLGLSAGTVKVLDYFTPSNYADLNAADMELGSGGVMLLPDQATTPNQLLVTGGKDASFYMADRGSLGKFHQDSNQVQQSFQLTQSIVSTPAYWNGRLYLQAAYDFLRSYDLNNGMLVPASASTVPALYGGASPEVSANGNSNGIVWVVHTNSGVQPQQGAILRAYDASDLSQELYDSAQAGTRDLPAADQGTHFTVPTVFNGKVYMTSGNELDIFGLLGT
jgi:hypothetical protein